MALTGTRSLLMPTSRPGLRWGAWLLGQCLLLPASLVGCGSGASRATAAQPAEELPPYDQEAARVFDDSISPEVFGLQVDRAAPKTDSLLRERSRLADHVCRVKLRTIREERYDEALRYKIVVQPQGAALYGEGLAEELELSVGRASPSLSMLRSMSVEAVGATFILLLKRYKLGDDPVLHFRGEPDSEEVLEAIRRANAPQP